MDNNGRLSSLDMLRGMTVAGMILVNNGYGESFEMLTHSHWNGMTPCDLVFPFFLFIMGISCYLSLSKIQFYPTRRTLIRVVKRTLLLFLIGLFINWFGLAIDGHPFDFTHLRLWAVLQRIALCYFFVSMFALFVRHRYVIPTVLLLLGGYSFLLILGNGYSENPNENLLAQVDLRLFGINHLYRWSPIDPEGLLGTISGTAHALIGFYCGRLIKTKKSIEQKMTYLFATGTICALTGYLLSYGLPLNKCVWSPSFVLVTCGLAASMQALIMFLVDYRPSKPPYSHFFHVFGMNALALYVISELLATLFWHYDIATLVYNVLHTIIATPKCNSLAYALTFVSINYAIGYLLYRRKIFVKL